VSSKAAPHDLAECPVVGTPRTLPYVLLCHATEMFCGRHWIANTEAEYEQHSTMRTAHELICAGRPQLTLH
jgi:hypothetical protein